MWKITFDFSSMHFFYKHIQFKKKYTTNMILKKPPFLGMAADLVLLGILDSVTATVGGYFVTGDLNLEVLSVNNGLTVI